MLLLRRKTFLGAREKIQIVWQIYWKLILMSLFMYLINNKVMIMFSYVNTQTFVWVFFCMRFCITTCQSEKTCTWNCSKIITIFHYSHYLFYENINQEHKLGMPDCVLGPFTYVCCKNCVSGYFDFVLNLSKSDNILFRKMANGIDLFSSA